MQRIPTTALARQIFDTCLRDGKWRGRALKTLVERALDPDDAGEAEAATRALFGTVIEGLADLFQPHLCDLYARIFSDVIGQALPEYRSTDLMRRYRRVRAIRCFRETAVKRIYVLSRVTLGADVAVTSVVMDAAKSRFPEADICFVGPEKNAELFAADARIVPIPFAYARGALLRERLAAAARLASLVDETDAIVIDPDSRLTQLGLIPICGESAYYFFESRSYCHTSHESLSELTARWMNEVFRLTAVPRSYLAPIPQSYSADITVSLGVGDNQRKRVDDDFECNVLSALARSGYQVIIDRGVGEDEPRRVDSLLHRLRYPATLHVHQGPVAAFANRILKSRLYIGYDSAGQHIASAANVPLVCIFAGYASDRMFERWRPTGSLARVIRADARNSSAVLSDTLEAIADTMAHVQAGSCDRTGDKFTHHDCGLSPRA